MWSPFSELLLYDSSLTGKWFTTSLFFRPLSSSSLSADWSSDLVSSNGSNFSGFSRLFVGLLLFFGCFYRCLAFLVWTATILSRSAVVCFWVVCSFSIRFINLPSSICSWISYFRLTSFKTFLLALEPTFARFISSANSSALFELLREFDFPAKPMPMCDELKLLLCKVGIIS